MQLRDYQQNMKDRLYDAWTKVSSVMLQMPTGTVKTHLMAAVIRENMEVGVLVVAHGTELIEQISKTLDKFEVPHGIINRKTDHAVAKTYRLLWEKWPEAKFLGLTATPCRMNNTGFTDLFDTLLESWHIQDFIDKGWLADFEYVSVTPDNWMVERIKGLKKRGVDGDYQTKEMATVMDTEASIEHLYQSYQQYAKGKKGIVYAISREHA